MQAVNALQAHHREAFADAPANCVQAEPLGVPTPTPITTVAGGDATVSTTVTVPVAVVVNVCESLPRTATVPVIVSVVTVAVGAVVVVVDVELVLESLLPQAAANRVNMMNRASPRARVVAAGLLITSAGP